MGYLYGVRDAKIALWNSTGSYGTLIDLPAVNRVEYNPRTSTGELEGDDEVVDSFSKIIGVEGRIVFADTNVVRSDIMNLLLGADVTSSGSKKKITIGEHNPNYFGLCWKVVVTDNSGEDHFMVYKARITNIQYSAAYGGYTVPEVSFTGVADNGDVIEVVENQPIDTALAMPLTY